MSKKYFLSLPNNLGKFVEERALELGITELDYIQYLIVRDKEGQK
jgi:hypothetical protein